MKLYLCLHNFSELWNFFSEVPWEIAFSVTSDNCFIISLACRKCKKNCNILNVILVQGFCPLKIEIARFPIGFLLKLSLFDLVIFGAVIWVIAKRFCSALPDDQRNRCEGNITVIGNCSCFKFRFDTQGTEDCVHLG